MSNLPNFPILRPSLLLDFANSKQVDPRISFTRASTATYYDAQGVLRTAASGVPRIDHDPVTGECNGLLIEEARTNLLKYSEQFDNAAWTQSGATVIPNAVTAPDGTLTGSKLVEGVANGEHFNDQALSVVSGTTYTLSAFAKGDGSGRYIVVRTALQGTASASFDLSNGVSSGSGDQLVSSGSKALGNGWYRCWIVFTASGTGTAVLRLQTNNAGTTVYTGDGTSGLYVWGAQLETGEFPTSYIASSTAATTRAADAASMTGTNFSEWANSVGTILAKYKTAGWKHNNTPPVTQLDLTKSVDNYSTSRAGDSIERLMFYPRQLIADQIAALKD